MTPEDRKTRIQQLKEKIAEVKPYQDELNMMIARCTHEDSVVPAYSGESSSGKCTICERWLGWYCPTSPTKQCDYNQPDGEYDEDHCIYCHHPEERK